MATKKVLVDTHVEIEINLPWTDKRDLVKYAERLRSEARDVKDFLRDHRSMDINDVYVVEEYGYKCENCGYIYDHDEESPECCEASIREWASQAILVDMGYEEE